MEPAEVLVKLVEYWWNIGGILVEYRRNLVEYWRNIGGI